jgi:hypothetical protein
MPTIATPIGVKRAIDPNCALTRHEFCALEGLSMDQYRKLLEEGNGPCERWLPGIDLPQITPQDRAKWQKRMAQSKIQNRIKRERKRRSEHFKRLGKLAVQSPNHISHRQKPKQAAE